MTRIIVSDAGPLIGLARVGRLSLLKSLYKSITIPPFVLEELKISSNKPGAKVVSEAIKARWIKPVDLAAESDVSILKLLVDSGEAESIQLALEKKASLLKLDCWQKN